MEFVGFPKIPRYSRECIITEKIDGTNGQILIEELEGYNSADAFYQKDGLALWVGSRTRWITPKTDNHGFARWAYDHADELLKLGPGRHFGEWWGQGIQRGYDLKEKRFSLFNVHRWGDDSVRPECCHVVPILMKGEFSSMVVYAALGDLQKYGSQAAPGFMQPEGIIIYHVAGNLMFKKTLQGDEVPKGGRE